MFRVDSGYGMERITICTRGIMSEHAVNQHGIRRGSHYLTYQVDRHPGCTFYLSVAAMVRRFKNAKVLDAAHQ